MAKSQVRELTDGTIKGWPVSCMIEYDFAGSKAIGLNCAAYTRQGADGDDIAPDEILDTCREITESCDDLTPAKAMRKAIAMGFVVDADQED